MAAPSAQVFIQARVRRGFTQSERRPILEDLSGGGGERMMAPTFFCDYGSISTVHAGVLQLNCVVLDGSQCGSDYRCSARFQTSHRSSVRRGLAPELCSREPVEIGADVWVGGGALILAGVHVGARAVIGAGSVVTRDIPEGVFAAGNPCRVIKDVS